MTDTTVPTPPAATGPSDPSAASAAGSAPASADPVLPDERMAQFATEVAELKLKTGKAKVERSLQILGVALMVAGIVLALGAYAASLNITATPGSNVDVLDAHSYEILALAGIGISLVGGFVFLRYSLARFLRFWLLRQSYEQQAAIARATKEG